MIGVKLLRWADVDPRVHPFDPSALREPLRVVIEDEARRAAPDRERLEQAIDRVVLVGAGAWASGWSWAASEPGGGGPVRAWCCANDSLLRAGEVPEATVERVLEALADWRGFLEQLARELASLDDQVRGLDTERAVERVAARLLVVVLELTGATDAWYGTLTTVVRWYLERAGLASARAIRALIDAVDGRFESWVEPAPAVATAACRELAGAVVQALVDPRRDDGLRAWRAVRTQLLRDAPARAVAPVVSDGHARFIAQVDEVRDRERAARMAAALLLCRDSARRGMPLTFDQLAEWQGVVLGASAPIELRRSDAYVGAERERYGTPPDLGAAFEAALGDAADPSIALPVRAARVYLDVCYFHPFADGNARAARLALDHVLTASGHALHAAGPVFQLVRSAHDARGLWAFARVVERLIGPVASAA